ncbi:alpha/beta hydrolase [Salinispirillum sp. LH 10-3-1]|uniref:Alpha/beta hydrolase n=1 Tax=Salinispirillum sp. LH 10-3-1 TaxID=2952525 RepID=A0AB38YC85_9GAMM
MREKKHELLGLTLAECQWGSGNFPVFALHGWQDNAASFAALGEALERKSSDYQLIAIDLPGHGHSSHFPASQFYNLWDYIPVLVARLELAAAPVWLLGHSLGGMLGTLIAALRPDLVRGIVTLDIVGLATDPVDRQLERYLASLTEQLQPIKRLAPAASLAAAIARRARIGSPVSAPANAQLTSRGVCCVGEGEAAEWHFRLDPRVRIGSVWRMLDDQAKALTARLTCPWHAILGESGFFSPNIVERLRLELPITTVTWWPGGHHFHMESQPDELWLTLEQRITL